MIGTNCGKRGRDDKIKAKGVSSSIKLQRDQFIDSLYNVNKVSYGSSEVFRYEKQTSTMNTFTQSRKLLNSFYTKFSVQPNLVTLLPLKENGALV